MGFYHTEENVEKYIKMAEGYDGQELVDILLTHLPAGASVLEIGMGPGVDLDILAQHYQVTGTDFSQVFVDRYQAMHPDSDLMVLDAVTMNTDRVFDGIYSNKVLHHLEDDELRQSIQGQHATLKPGGIVMHSFWYGDMTEEHFDMKFHYRDEKFLGKVFSVGFEILSLDRYTEMEDDDSILVIAKREEEQ